MNSGPSKEQLESLFKTSRKYFDEMAKEYYAKDRDFYNKNFAPFYNNPFAAVKKGGKPVRLILVMGLSIFIAIMGFVFALFFTTKHSEVEPVKQSESSPSPVKKEYDEPAATKKDSVENETIKLEKLQKELKQKETEVKENSSKREVKSKPIERIR